MACFRSLTLDDVGLKWRIMDRKSFLKHNQDKEGSFTSKPKDAKVPNDTKRFAATHVANIEHTYI